MIKLKGIPIPAREDRSYPIDDAEAWEIHGSNAPHLFDRMWLARAQGVVANPHGVPPGAGLVWSRPIMDLGARGAGARVIDGFNEHNIRAGHFWAVNPPTRMRCVDLVCVEGEVVWRYTVDYERNHNGTIFAFRGSPGADQALPIETMLQSYLPGHTGVVCSELGGYPDPDDPESDPDKVKRIEIVTDIHFRPNMEFVDFYGDGWLEAVEELYRERKWVGSTPGDVGDSRFASVVAIRTAKETGHTYNFDMAAMRNLEAELVIVDFEPGKTLTAQSSDEWTYRLGLVGDPDPVILDGSARLMAEGMKMVAGGYDLQRVG